MKNLNEKNRNNYYQNFLTNFFEKNVLLLKGYRKKKDLIRIPIPMDLFWSFNPLVAKQILTNPEKIFPETELFLSEFCKTNGFFRKITNFENLRFRIDLLGPFFQKHNSVNGLRSNSLGELVCIQGIVVECGKKKVQNKKTVHFCPTTRKLFVNKGEYGKNFSYSFFKENQKKELETEYGLSLFEDWQKIVIQDITTSPLSNEVPGKINVILENDLVENCKPNDRIEICGIIKPIPEGKIFERCQIFSTMLKALSLRNLNSEKFLKAKDSDVMIMKSFSTLANSFERLSSLIAPDILGQTDMKKGILLSLIGGEGEKKDKKKSFLREEINLLLVGGFSEQKERILEFISKLSPLTLYSPRELFWDTSIYDFDLETFETRSLPFVQKGTFLIPNIDKIPDPKKVFLKEILDHRSVLFNKNKNSPPIRFKCNSIATMEFFDKKKGFFEVVKNEFSSTKTFLSHFDCIFFLSETNSLEEDKKFSEHLFRTQLNKKSFIEEPIGKISNIFQAFSYYGKKNKLSKSRLSYNFLKNFFFFSKFRVNPILTEEAAEIIVHYYLEWKFEKNYILPVTIRKLETIIRLSFAYSKCHLREKVSVKDAKYVYFFLKKLVIEQNQPSLSNKKLLRKKETHFFSPNPFSLSNWIPKEMKKKKWFVKEKIVFFNKNLRKEKKTHLEFFFLKKIWSLNKKKSFGEKILIEWSKKSLCLILSKNILRF